MEFYSSILKVFLITALMLFHLYQCVAETPKEKYTDFNIGKKVVCLENIWSVVILESFLLGGAL